jgi:hypothetical protein
MSPALASWVTAAAVDVRRVFHGFALRAAIAAAFRCHAGAGWMRAFVRFSLSHVSFPSLDRICLWSIDLLLFDAPAALRAPLPRAVSPPGAGPRRTFDADLCAFNRVLEGVQWSRFRNPKQILVEAKGDLS